MGLFKVKCLRNNDILWGVGVTPFEVGDILTVVEEDKRCYRIEGHKGWFTKERFEKVGDEKMVKKVMCLWHSGSGLLTTGRVYEVTKENDDMYFIIDNTGTEMEYRKCKFEVVEDKPKNTMDVRTTIGHTITDENGREFIGEHTITDKYDLVSLEKAQKIAICRAEMKQLESKLAELLK